jgi:hypothetical protein
MWLLLALGLAAAFRILYPVLKTRRDPVSKAFVFEFGVRPSGPGGSWTRRDRALSGLLSLLTAAGCVGVMIGAERISQHAMNGSTASNVATGIMFVFALLALLALLRGLADLVRAPFTKVGGAP